MDEEQEIESQTQAEGSETTHKVKMGGGASNLRPWLFKKGVSGNPGGMKKGTVSLKVWARNYIQGLNDEEKMAFMDGLPKDIIWRMSEGQPHQSTDMEVKANLKIEFAPEFNKDNKPIDDQ